jgi:hypothetical protein
MGRISVACTLFLVLIITLSCLTIVRTANAQTTLGPIVSMQNGGGNIRIDSIQNQTSLSNPIELVFRIEAYLLPYCYERIGDVGYSLDGLSIVRVDNFMNKSIVHMGDTDIATIFVKVNLPLLDKGQHNVTTYWGWQYQGTQENPKIQRYEVMAYSSTSFQVVNTEQLSSSPSESLPTLTPDIPRGAPHIDPTYYLIPVIMVAVVVIGIVLFRRYRKL